MAFADIKYSTKNGVKTETSRTATYPTWVEFLTQMDDAPQGKKKNISAPEILDAVLNH